MILLSFDFEEFDTPNEFGAGIPLEEQIRISNEGAVRVLDLLDRLEIPATLFCTCEFIRLAPDIADRLATGEHEIASHSIFHGAFETDHPAVSRSRLSERFNRPIVGFRMPRMAPVANEALAKAGFTYNSSINPTFIPGRYNALGMPRQPVFESGLWQVPASVTPLLRFPLFWLSFHLLPLSFFRWLCLRTLRHDGHVCLYFHPWEFSDLSSPELRLPAYLRRNTGRDGIVRLELLLRSFLKSGNQFCTMQTFVAGLGGQPQNDQ